MSIPELKLKKIGRTTALVAKSDSACEEREAKAVFLAKSITARAKSYEEEYNQIASDAINNRRIAKSEGEIFVKSEDKLVFVIRVRGIIGVSPKVKKILQLLRLRQLHNGVFVRVSAAIIKMLRLVEPFIAYGFPSLKTIKDLIYKRGFGKLMGQRIPLSSNTVVSATLGEFGMDCVEDVIHEIVTVGPNFKAASNFLWPFKLSSPKGGFRGKMLNHFNEDGACGQQQEKINALIKKML